MSSDRNRRALLETEIRARLGLVPALFRIGASIDISVQLWSQAKASYLDSSIPSVFKEELFTYLSRFCEVPYCMARHAAFLQGVGCPAGDAAAPAREPEEVLRLLRRPLARSDELEGHVKTLAGYAEPIEAWPEDGRSVLGEALLACSVHVFLRGGPKNRCLVELRRVLGPEKLQRLIALLAFVRSAHAWTESQPGIEFERDVEDLLQEQPELRSWIERYRSAVRAELGAESSADFLCDTSEYRTLQQSRERFGVILDDSLNEIYVFDSETLRFTQVNQGARQNLGYSMEEFRELTPLDLKPEFTAQSFGELISPLRSGEKSRTEFTTVHRRKDGSLYPVEVHLQLSSAAGSRAFVAIILDITERLAQQEALAESEARAQTILKTAPDAIITINELGVIEGVNPATSRLFGYGEPELIGQNVQILMPPAHAEEHDGYLERYRRTGEARVVGRSREVEGRGKDGSVFPIRISVGEVATERGRLFTGFLHDLREQKEAEAERDEAERRLRAVFNQRASLAGLCTLEGILVDANKASLDYVGVERSDVVGRPFWETPWWSHDSALQQQLRRGLERAAQGEFVHFDAFHPRVEGTMGTVDFSITPVTNSDGMIEILLVESVDVTEKRKLQEQLLQSQKMEAIGTLAGGIAHDFNNLLTSIRGSSEILVDHLEPGGRLARSAERIQKAADRATALTMRLLGFSRKQVAHRRPLDLNETVSEARELFASTLREDVELKTNLSAEALYVRADESQVAQVLMNLVVNAGDAMPGGGSLLLETIRESVYGKRSAVLDLAPGDYVALRVSDTGEGIPPETLGKIFDAFFTTKDVGKGTGLGLSTAFGIIREHCGAIEVESEVGTGTAFTVLLPEIAAPVAASMEGVESVARARTSGETVLLVEDDEIIRDLLGEVLEEEGYVVVAAADPDAALSRARDHDGGIDIVITDVVMPIMSGFLLAKELRSHHPNVRVLYMSGYTDQVLADHGELKDDDPFICKPFGNDSILDKVREVLDASPRRSA